MTDIFLIKAQIEHKQRQISQIFAICKFHLLCHWLALKLKGKLLSPLLNTKHIEGHLILREQRLCRLLKKNR